MTPLTSTQRAKIYRQAAERIFESKILWHPYWLLPESIVNDAPEYNDCIRFGLDKIKTNDDSLAMITALLLCEQISLKP